MRAYFRKIGLNLTKRIERKLSATSREVLDYLRISQRELKVKTIDIGSIAAGGQGISQRELKAHHNND